GGRARGVGAELRPGAGSEGAWRAADRDEADPLGAGQDLAQLVGPDANHRSREKLELAAVGDERRGAAQRDVDLFLVRVERVGAVLVVWVAVPVGREREDLHPPGAHAELGARTAGEAAVDRLHLVDRLHRYVHHRAPPRRKSSSGGSTRPRGETNRHGRIEFRQPTPAELLLGERAALRDRALGDRLEPARLGREDDPEGTPVAGVALAAYQLLSLEQAHHRRHRLLAEPGAGGELALTQAVLLEERHEDRAVARAHVAPAGGA